MMHASVGRAVIDAAGASAAAMYSASGRGCDVVRTRAGAGSRPTGRGPGGDGDGDYRLFMTSVEVSALLAPPPGVHTRYAAELGSHCGPEDWPPLRTALLDPATPDQVIMGCLSAIRSMVLGGTVDPDDVRPVLDAVAGRTAAFCAFASVDLLAVLPRAWAVTALRRFVAAGRPGYDALTALADHPHVLGLRTARSYIDDPDAEVRRTARALVDLRLARTIADAVPVPGAGPPDPDAQDRARRALAALIALDSWALVLHLLRSGQLDEAARAGVADLPDDAVTGPGRAATLRRIRRAARS